ncbi:hypothetical protein BTVI_11517 [Pitangus sulphuratus]|nr:hypothetical protein BTVI_11517 [Pitangus sulphuratus]
MNPRRGHGGGGAAEDGPAPSAVKSMAVTLEQARRVGYTCLKALLRFAFMVANNLVAIPSYVLYLIMLQPLRMLDSKSFWPFIIQFSPPHGYLKMSNELVLFCGLGQCYPAGTGEWCRGVWVEKRGPALGRNNRVHQHRLGADLLESSFGEKHLGVLVDKKLSLSQQCVLVAKKASGVLGCIRKSISSSSREVILSLRPVVEWGDDVKAVSEDEAMVLVNHQATGDVCTLMMCLQDKGTMMWLMDHIFKYTNFGIVSLIHGDFFIRQGRAHRDQQLVLLKDHLEKYYRSRNRKWIVLFPEGGFLRKRRETSQAFAKKNNLPFLKHVTLPRLGATQVILKTLVAPQENGTPASGDTVMKESKAKGLQWVIDTTIAYPKGEPIDIQTWILGYRQPTVTHVHYRIFPVKDVPAEPEALTDWLYQRFIEKEDLLTHFYETDNRPTHKVFPVSKDLKGRNPELVDRGCPSAPLSSSAQDARHPRKEKELPPLDETVYKP